MGLVNIRKGEGILHLILNRPEKKNALFPDFLKEIEVAMRSAGEFSVMIMSGQGGFFSAGGDLSVMLSEGGERGMEFSKVGNEFMDFLQNYEAITIAAIEGGAYGGGLELALSCDMRVASPHAKIGLTEINLGLLPGWGGLKRISKVAGQGAARYVALTGKVMDGEEAYRLGLVTYLSDDPVKFSENLAIDLSKKPRESIRRIKLLLGQDEYSSEMEEKMFGEILNTPSARSRLEKFLKK